jgi:hypothetical protein
MFVISTPFPWSPLKLYSNSTPWSGNGVEFQKLNGVGVGMKLELELEWNGVRNFELFTYLADVLVQTIYSTSLV